MKMIETLNLMRIVIDTKISPQMNPMMSLKLNKHDIMLRKKSIFGNTMFKQKVLKVKDWF